MKNHTIVLSLEALPQQAGAAVPEWVRLLPLGTLELTDGRDPLEVDRESLNAVMTAFRQRGVDAVIDYEHQTLTGQKAPAAGWIKEMEVRDDGLWARVAWTPQAQEHLRTREYRYYSPVLRLDPETRKPLALLHAALTNIPAIRGLDALAAKAQELDPENRNQKTENLNPKQEAAKAMKEKLITILALKAEAPEEEIFTAALARLEQQAPLIAALPEVAQALALKADAGVSEIVGAVKGLMAGQDRLTQVETEMTALKNKLAESEAETAVDEALKAGKLIPAQRDWGLDLAKKDLAAFKAFVEKAPVVVPLSNLGGPPKPKPGAALTPDELEICRQTGVTAEAFKAERDKHLTAP